MENGLEWACKASIGLESAFNRGNDGYGIDMAKSAKSLSERIAERAQKKKQPGRAGKNRAAFLAVRDEVRQALDDGWPVKDVWETLYAEGAIAFRYDAFIGYVKKLIRQPATAAAPSIPAVQEAPARPATPAKTPTAKPKPSPAPATPEPVVTKPNTPAGFSFDSTPRKEDLL